MPCYEHTNPRNHAGLCYIVDPIWSYRMAIERTFSIVKPDAVAKNVIG